MGGEKELFERVGVLGVGRVEQREVEDRSRFLMQIHAEVLHRKIEAKGCVKTLLFHLIGGAGGFRRGVRDGGRLGGWRVFSVTSGRLRGFRSLSFLVEGREGLDGGVEEVEGKGGEGDAVIAFVFEHGEGAGEIGSLEDGEEGIEIVCVLEEEEALEGGDGLGVVVAVVVKARGGEEGSEELEGVLWCGEACGEKASEGGIPLKEHGFVDVFFGLLGLFCAMEGDAKPKLRVIPEGVFLGAFDVFFPVVEDGEEGIEGIAGLFVGEGDQGEVVMCDKQLAGESPIFLAWDAPRGVLACGVEGFLVSALCGIGERGKEGAVTDPEPIEGFLGVVDGFFLSS